MYKLVALLKRRQGLSMNEFIDYYETTHSKIGDKVLRGNSVKYIRRYFHPIVHPSTGEEWESEYDGLMEIWFTDYDQAQSTLAMFAEPAMAKLLIEDEEKLVDRSKLRLFTVEEHESDVIKKE